jgi:hypothetical protein
VIGPIAGTGAVVREAGKKRPQMPPKEALAAAAEPVDLPISADEVRTIASRGFPLVEPVEAMQLRNRRITLAYGDLSVRLAALLARGGRRQANWCTFSTWSSKTIGGWIERDPEPDPADEPPWWMPGFVGGVRRSLLKWAMKRDNGATYRALAAGNRFVFLEIGTAFGLFLDAFEGATGESPDDAAWDRYWAEIARELARQGRLDPSWMLTETPPAEELQLGLRQYYEALFTTDPKLRAERVLAGNLLIGAYEQRRVQGYVACSLALFSNHAMRRLVTRRFDPDRTWRHMPAWVYARLVSPHMVLKLPDEKLVLGQPLPPPAGAPLFPEDLQAVTTPLVQALLTRYDLAGGRDDDRRVRNWCSYDDRMNYIANLFRSRQQHEPLFGKPFPPDVEQRLLDGELAPSATTAIPPGAGP